MGKKLLYDVGVKTTDQARLMLNMVEKTNIEITDIGPKGKGPNYTYYREKMGNSYIDHVLVSKNLTHKIKRCTIADDCILKHQTTRRLVCMLSVIGIQQKWNHRWHHE